MTLSIRQFGDAQLGAAERAYAEITGMRRLRTAFGLAVLAALFAIGCWTAEVRPTVLWAKIGNFSDYFSSTLHLEDGAWVWTEPVEWFWGLGRWSALIGQTLMMAYAGTLLGSFAGLLLSFAASRNFNGSTLLRGTVRRFLEFSRTVPDLVFALIFVIAFGLGPIPGVLAIAIHTMGALGKLFAEVIENIDIKPVEGIAASGGSLLQQIRFGALPQVQSNFVSYALLRFEVNVRSAAVLGFVGAGGIGFTLVIAIRKFYYSDVSAMLLMIIATVMLIDYGTERIRHRLLGRIER